MGPGFKYHVVTIAAIFFALTVGLVVGSLYVSPRLAANQTQAIKKLQDAYSTDIALQRQQLTPYKKFASEALPALLRNRLNRASVAIVLTGDYPALLTPIREALQMAGARVTEVSVGPAFDRPDEVLESHLAAAQSQDLRLPTDRTGVADALAMILAYGDKISDGMLSALEREKFVITDSESDYSLPARYVVIVGGSRNADATRPANVDGPLIQSLQKHGIVVAACEPQDAQVSDMPAYRDLHLDIATVDNVDTDIGRCALVYALGGDKDDYGTKPTAARLMPSLLAKHILP